MKENEFLDGISHIGSDVVERFMEMDHRLQKKAEKSKKIWIRLGALAACFFVMFGCVTVFYRLQENSVITHDSSGDFTNNSYVAPPDSGNYFCFMDVNAARNRYTGRKVEFLLAFDIFEGESEVTCEALQAEYQRLVDLGYKLYYIEDHWTYDSNGQKKYIPVVVGLFTEEQLSDFDVNEKYGYVFRFETNGDGSPVSFHKKNMITDFG